MQAPESASHLLSVCPYAKEIWHLAISKLGLPQSLNINGNEDMIDWWQRSSQGMNKETAKSWRSVMALVWWILWKERNERIFRNTSCTSARLFEKIQLEAQDWVDAGRRRVLAIVERPLEPD